MILCPSSTPHLMWIIMTENLKYNSRWFNKLLYFGGNSFNVSEFIYKWQIKKKWSLQSFSALKCNDYSDIVNCLRHSNVIRYHLSATSHTPFYKTFWSGYYFIPISVSQIWMLRQKEMQDHKGRNKIWTQRDVLKGFHFPSCAFHLA